MLGATPICTQMHIYMHSADVIASVYSATLVLTTKEGMSLQMTPPTHSIQSCDDAITPDTAVFSQATVLAILLKDCSMMQGNSLLQVSHGYSGMQMGQKLPENPEDS